MGGYVHYCTCLGFLTHMLSYVVIPCIFQVYSMSFEFVPVSESRALQRQSPKPLPGLPSRSSWTMQEVKSEYHMSPCFTYYQYQQLQHPAIYNSECKQHVLSICAKSRRKSRGNHEATRHNLITIRSRRVTVQVCKLRLLLAQDLANGLPNLPSWIGSDEFSHVSVCIRSEAGA